MLPPELAIGVETRDIGVFGPSARLELNEPEAGVLKVRGCGAFSVAQLFIPKGYQTLAGG